MVEQVETVQRLTKVGPLTVHYEVADGPRVAEACAGLGTSSAFYEPELFAGADG